MGQCSGMSPESLRSQVWTRGSSWRSHGGLALRAHGRHFLQARFRSARSWLRPTGRSWLVAATGSLNRRGSGCRDRGLHTPSWMRSRNSRTAPVIASTSSTRPWNLVPSAWRRLCTQRWEESNAAADPFGGGCTGTINTAHWQRSAPQIAQPLGGWSGRVSSSLQSAFWQRQLEHPRARDIVAAFGDEARKAGERVVALGSGLPQCFPDALPQLLACLD